MYEFWYMIERQTNSILKIKKMTTFKLIYTATGNDVLDNHGYECVYNTKEEALKEAKAASLFEFEQKPFEFSEGGFLYGTSTPIVSIQEVEDEE